MQKFGVRKCTPNLFLLIIGVKILIIRIKFLYLYYNLKQNISMDYIERKELEMKVAKNELLKVIKNNYTKIKSKTMDRESYPLTDFDQFVYLILLKYENMKKKVSYPSQETIGRIIYGEDKISYPKISKSVHKLVNTGLIEIIKDYIYDTDKGATITKNYYTIKELPDENSYIKIPNSLILSTLIPWKERLFAAKLFQFVYNDRNMVNMQRQELAKRIGISTVSLNKYINILVEKDIIRIKKFGFQINLFRLLDISEEYSVELLSEIDKMRKEIVQLRIENKELKAKTNIN